VRTQARAGAVLGCRASAFMAAECSRTVADPASNPAGSRARARADSYMPIRSVRRRVGHRVGTNLPRLEQPAACCNEATNCGVVLLAMGLRCGVS